MKLEYIFSILFQIHELPTSSVFQPVPVPPDDAAGTRASTAEGGVAGVVDLTAGLGKEEEESSRCRLNASAVSCIRFFDMTSFS